GVARPDLGAVAVGQLVADLHVAGGQDVALLAVVVVEQGDAAVAVRVVLDGRHGGRHAVLVPLEVDDAVLLLVAATTVAGRLAAVGVAPTGARLGGQQRPLGGGLGDLGEVGDRLEPAAGRGGLALAERHGGLSSLRTARCGRPRRG